MIKPHRLPSSPRLRITMKNGISSTATGNIWVASTTITRKRRSGIRNRASAYPAKMLTSSPIPTVPVATIREFRRYRVNPDSNTRW